MRLSGSLIFFKGLEAGEKMGCESLEVLEEGGRNGNVSYTLYTCLKISNELKNVFKSHLFSCKFHNYIFITE